ncbi:MAG: PmoA family protein [bacterium]|nr:PmoA family protein [bacterium]
MHGEVSVHTADLAACARVEAPLRIDLPPDRALQRAAEEGRLQLVDKRSGQVLEAQWLDGSLWTIAPSSGLSGRLIVRVVSAPAKVRLRAYRDRPTRQIVFEEDRRPVLQYNYWTIDRPDRHAQVSPENRIYSRPRSNYIHPLYGLQGEVITEDWPVDHPHHRGIYWAWPEVDYRGERGDLHALQHVFACPTGRYRVTAGTVFTQVEAESVWRWESGEPVVVEWARIRAYRRTQQGRCVDLAFFFTALKEPVLLARRGTNLYGGLNMRLSAIQHQKFVFHTEGEQAWAGAFGVFPEGDEPAGLLIFPHVQNPYHPPDWVQYPNLNWIQPTFPSAGLRHELQPGKPLALRYRLWIRPGTEPPPDLWQAQWQAYQSMERGDEV